MSGEEIFVYDSTGAIIHDPRRSLVYATGLQWDTHLPGGYGPASFTVKRDIAEVWAVRMAYKVKVYDGNTVVYEGRIGGLEKQLQGNDQSITVPVNGFWELLTERRLAKHWGDSDAVSRMQLNKRNNEQKAGFQVDKKENDWTVKFNFPGGAVGTELYEEYYEMPPGQTIKRITFDARRIGGTDKAFLVVNGNGTTEYSTLPGTSNAAVTINLATPTRRVVFKTGPNAANIYEPQDDAIILEDVTIYSETSNFTAKDIIEDILPLVNGGEISTDYSQIADPALAIFPFIITDPETADKVILKAAGYGDASFNTWSPAIWSSDRASDSLPRFYFNYRSVSSPKWYVSLEEITGFDDKESKDELYNYMWGKFTNAKGITVLRSPDLSSSLKDTASIAKYGRCDSPVIDLGNSTTAQADQYLARSLAYHKDPLRQTRGTLTGTVTDVYGVRWPVNRIKSGDTLKIVDYRGGDSIYLRKTSYKADKKELTFESDLPQNSLEIMLNQRELS